jgi:hypothetical protein
VLPLIVSSHKGVTRVRRHADPRLPSCGSATLAEAANLYEDANYELSGSSYVINLGMSHIWDRCASRPVIAYGERHSGPRCGTCRGADDVDRSARGWRPLGWLLAAWLTCRRGRRGGSAWRHALWSHLLLH